MSERRRSLFISRDFIPGSAYEWDGSSTSAPVSGNTYYIPLFHSNLDKLGQSTYFPGTSSSALYQGLGLTNSTTVAAPTCYIENMKLLYNPGSNQVSEVTAYVGAGTIIGSPYSNQNRMDYSIICLINFAIIPGASTTGQYSHSIVLSHGIMDTSNIRYSAFFDEGGYIRIKLSSSTTMRNKKVGTGNGVPTNLNIRPKWTYPIYINNE